MDALLSREVRSGFTVTVRISTMESTLPAANELAKLPSNLRFIYGVINDTN